MEKEVVKSFHLVECHPHYQYVWRNTFQETNPICLVPHPQSQLNFHSKHQHDPLFHICERKQMLQDGVMLLNYGTDI